MIIKKSQWSKWLIVFFLMSFFTLFQMPISKYALGVAEKNTSTSIDQQITEIVNEVEGENLNSQNDKEAELEINHHDEEINVDSNEEGNDESSDGTNLEDIEESVIESDGEDSDEEDGTEEDSINKKKPVYLTIDDGPSIVSDQILDILASYEIQATFFVLEPRVRYYSDMVNRMNIEGHKLGVHGVTHDVKRFYASPESAVNEFNSTRYSLRELTGEEHYLARTPYGSCPYLSEEQEKTILQEGYKIWDWNVDSRDWYFRNERYVQFTISQLERLHQNGTIPVILIHELGTTARHLPLLIDYLLANDYEFIPLDLEGNPVRLR
ncbi:MAG: hypothetical protein APF84_19515 [Gracilibacter sp. BRH_c7a]|nr:MAG: hypothetical protein APF84_19515 [Gracilibacter sp. BRH_c7a]